MNTIQYLADDLLKEQLKNYKLKTKQVVSPVLVIKYGPPASGKGECNKKFVQSIEKIKKAKFFDENNSISIDIDKYVESLDINNTITQNPDNYWNFRPYANKIGDQMLKFSIKNKRNVVVEMTGNTIDPKWLHTDIINPAKLKNYIIVIMYPLVPIQLLISRSDERAKKIGRQPKHSDIKKAAINAANNIHLFYGSVDSIIIYDNSGVNPCDNIIIKCNNITCTIEPEWLIKNINNKFGITVKDLQFSTLSE